MRVFCRPKYLSLVRWPTSVGMAPSSELINRCSEPRLVRRPISVGSVPETLDGPILKTTPYPDEYPGVVPSPKCRSPISVGSVPLRP